MVESVISSERMYFHGVLRALGGYMVYTSKEGNDFRLFFKTMLVHKITYNISFLGHTENDP